MDELPDEMGIELEKNFVKQTYDHIATDFSSTRYKKWPKVEAFVRDLPGQPLLLDVGCGNGKYLDCATGFSIGCDISRNLLTICKSKGFEVVLCDMTKLPFRDGLFDAVICVAALHHIVGSPRRSKCLEGISRTMSVDKAQLLIQVWSYEQERETGNPYLRKHPAVPGTNEIAQTREEVEINDRIKMPIHVNRAPFQEQDLLVPFSVKSGCSKAEDTRHLRFYHVFKEKELDSLIERIPELELIHSYYDRGNWCVIASRRCQATIEPSK